MANKLYDAGRERALAELGLEKTAAGFGELASGLGRGLRDVGRGAQYGMQSLMPGAAAPTTSRYLGGLFAKGGLQTMGNAVKANPMQALAGGAGLAGAGGLAAGYAMGKPEPSPFDQLKARLGGMF